MGADTGNGSFFDLQPFCPWACESITVDSEIAAGEVTRFDSMEALIEDLHDGG